MVERTITVTPSPAELGEAFAGLNSQDMACFFNAVAHCVKAEGWSFCLQMGHVSGQSELNNDARELFRTIGSHADKTGL